MTLHAACPPYEEHEPWGVCAYSSGRLEAQMWWMYTHPSARQYKGHRTPLQHFLPISRLRQWFPRAWWHCKHARMCTDPCSGGLEEAGDHWASGEVLLSALREGSRSHSPEAAVSRSSAQTGTSDPRASKKEKGKKVIPAFGPELQFNKK